MIVLEPGAESEYEQIYRHYETISTKIALRFEEQFVRTWNLIDAWPQMYPIVAPPDYRRALLSRFPYSIFYREVSPTVREIVAVAHSRRRPGHWMEGWIMEEAAAYMAHCERKILLAEAT